MNLQKARLFVASNGLESTPAGKKLEQAEAMVRRYRRKQWKMFREGREYFGLLANDIRATVMLPEIFSQLFNELSKHGYTTRH